MGIKQRNFIAIHDVKSKIERINLGSNYDNYIIISTRIFDFEVKSMDLIEFVLQFRREKYRSRKRALVLDIESPTFTNDLKDYLTVGELVEDDNSVVDLFNSVGTRGFATHYLEVCSKVPTPKVNKAIITFLNRVRAGSETLYYKKAIARLGKKMERNMFKALKETNRISRCEAELQLNFIMAHQILFEC